MSSLATLFLESGSIRFDQIPRALKIKDKMSTTSIKNDLVYFIF